MIWKLYHLIIDGRSSEGIEEVPTYENCSFSVQKQPWNSPILVDGDALEIYQDQKILFILYSFKISPSWKTITISGVSYSDKKTLQGRLVFQQFTAEVTSTNTAEDIISKLK